MFFSTRSAMRHKTLPRSLADILRQGPFTSSNALRADATAWSTPLAPPSAIWVNTSPVAGLKVSNDFPEPSDHLPSIKSLPGETFALVAVIMSFSIPSEARDRDPRIALQGSLIKSQQFGRNRTGLLPPVSEEAHRDPSLRFGM